MAVNYETGVASDPSDLLEKFITFITGNGWTFHTPASGDAVVSNGDIFAGIDADSTSWRTRGCLDFDNGSAYDAQPNNSGVTNQVVWGAGPFIAYHFFVGDEDGADYAHVTVEVSAGNFRHWVLGSLVKSGTWTGGTYVDCATPSTQSNQLQAAEHPTHRYICDANQSTGVASGHIWIDYDSKTNNWGTVHGASQIIDDDALSGSFRGSGIYAPFWVAGAQSWNLRTPLFPAIYFAHRASSLKSPIGRIPNFRFVHMRNLVPGQTVTYADSDWMVFPVFVRRDTTPSIGNLSSGLYGYAHLLP